MIVVTLILGVLFAFIFFIYINNKPTAYILTALSLLVAITSMVFIIKNDGTTMECTKSQLLSAKKSIPLAASK